MFFEINIAQNQSKALYTLCALLVGSQGSKNLAKNLPPQSPLEEHRERCL